MLMLTMLFVICTISYGCSPSCISPDGSKTLEHFVVNDLVCFRVLDQKGVEIFSVNTNASAFHTWSIKWDECSRIVLESADIGTYAWAQQEDDTWQKFGKLPDGTWQKETSSE